MGLLFLMHSADVLPALYRGSMPYGYHELVDQSGLEGADTAAEFKRNHDQLVSGVDRPVTRTLVFLNRAENFS
jgi:hypothetical protein